MFVLDCSECPPQDWLRTADGVVAVYPTLEDAQHVARVLGGIVRPSTVVPLGTPMRVV